MILMDLATSSNINNKIANQLMIDTGTNNIRELFEYFKKMDIREFIRLDNCISWEPTEKQYEIMEGIMANHCSIILLGKGSAKTSICAIIMRFMSLLDMLEDELEMNRIDFCNMCSTAKSAKNSFFRELTEQLRRSRIFNVIKKLYNIRKQDISFLNEQIMIHSLNSETSSFEGMNIKMALIDEISDENYKNAIPSWEQAQGSVDTRFGERGKCVAISWTRFPTANPLTDAGYYLYNKYKNDPKVYTIKASHKEVRGSNPIGYDPENIKHLKMYDCEFILDEDCNLDIDKISFVKEARMLELRIFEGKNKEGQKLTMFEPIRLVAPKTKYCFCHIDTSISRDSTVIALYYGNRVEYHTIKPLEGTKISYEHIEFLVKRLKSICKIISFDQFNSEYFVQKYGCFKHKFGNLEQYNALKYFQTQLNNFQIIKNLQSHKRLEEEINGINIDNKKKVWKYLGDGSSDIIDSIFYAVYNSKAYENELKQEKKNKIGKNFNVFEKQSRKKKSNKRRWI